MRFLADIAVRGVDSESLLVYNRAEAEIDLSLVELGFWAKGCFKVLEGISLLDEDR